MCVWRGRTQCHHIRRVRASVCVWGHPRSQPLSWRASYSAGRRPPQAGRGFIVGGSSTSCLACRPTAPRAGVACEGGGLVCWPDPTSWLVNAASALGMTGLRQVRGFPFLICKRETPAPTCGTVLFWSGEMMVELVKVGGFCHIMGDLIIIYPLPQIIFFLPEGRLWRARCHL